jgi:molybdopterin synthase catalytic subunit
MDIPLFAVKYDTVDLLELINSVTHDINGISTTNGAVASFVGLVRGENLGKRILHLEYEAYEPLAVKTFVIIAKEAQEKWPGVRIAVHHRLGQLQVGDPSIAVVTASPHRDAAFSTCRYTIERIKQIAPIWKHEFFEGGDVWIEGATADPDDETAREDAYKRACA